MKTITIESQAQTGLFGEHRGAGGRRDENVRLTIPAREALERAGATVTLAPALQPGAPQTYTIEHGATMPRGLVGCITQGDGWYGMTSVRLVVEPAYPNEYASVWVRADYLPCPECGAPLVWYEAGYVPGYRVCVQRPHHHSLIVQSRDDDA